MIILEKVHCEILSKVVKSLAGWMIRASSNAYVIQSHVDYSPNIQYPCHHIDPNTGIS